MDFNGIEGLNIRTLGSADTVNVNRLTGTDLATVNVDLSGFDGTPDGVADTVNVIGTDGADNATVGGTGGVVTVTGLGDDRARVGRRSRATASVSTRSAATTRSPTAS